MNNFQNPFLNPYGFQPQYQTMPQSMPVQQVVRVSGENGARSYQMGANSSVLLLDETEPIVWLKTTDGASYAIIINLSIPTPNPDIGGIPCSIELK